MRIEGRVQGVGFRYWTERNARNLDLGGWVRNGFDGSVEAVFSGTRPNVDDMLARCLNGPSLAFVETVDVVEEGGEPIADFLLRRTR